MPPKLTSQIPKANTIVSDERLKTFPLRSGARQGGPLSPLLFPGGSDSKESACNTGDLGSIPGSGRSSGERNGNPLQYSCLDNSRDRGAWQVTVPGVAKSQTQLND